MRLETQEQRLDGRADIADDAEVDGHAPPDDFAPDINLGDASPTAARIELAVGKIGPEHEQDVAVEHRVIARREADQPRHPDVKRVVPFDMLFAFEGMDDRRLAPLGERDDLIVRAGAARSAQHGHAAIRVQKRREALKIALRRDHRGRRRGEPVGLGGRRI